MPHIHVGVVRPQPCFELTSWFKRCKQMETARAQKVFRLVVCSAQSSLYGTVRYIDLNDL